MQHNNTAAPDEDLFAIMEEEIRAAVLRFGLPAAVDVAASAVDGVARRAGGGLIYLRTARSRERQRVQAEMRSKFNGANLHELAREYGMSLRNARRIVSAG